MTTDNDKTRKTIVKINSSDQVCDSVKWDMYYIFPFFEQILNVQIAFQYNKHNNVQELFSSWYYMFVVEDSKIEHIFYT